MLDNRNSRYRLQKKKKSPDLEATILLRNELARAMYDEDDLICGNADGISLFQSWENKIMEARHESHIATETSGRQHAIELENLGEIVEVLRCCQFKLEKENDILRQRPGLYCMSDDTKSIYLDFSSSALARGC